VHHASGLLYAAPARLGVHQHPPQTYG
jgi:hypothetical protein